MNIQQILIQELYNQAVQKNHNPSQIHTTNPNIPCFYAYNKPAHTVDLTTPTIKVEYKITATQEYTKIDMPTANIGLWNTITISLEDPKLIEKIWQFIEK